MLDFGKSKKMNSYDKWKMGDYESDSERQEYTIEDLLREDLSVLESRLRESETRCAAMKKRLEQLAEINVSERTFGRITSDEYLLKNKILEFYEKRN
jgi:exonuclease VII large subunit